MFSSFDSFIVPNMADSCKECGCTCSSCSNHNSLDLHHEIEDLRSQLSKSKNHIAQMEIEFADSRDYADQEISKLQDELGKLRERYERLFESHKKLQKLNHNLEDKLLSIVNKVEIEKTDLQKELSTVNSKLLDSKVTICEIEEECERYRNDCNVAVQLLQCKPSNFVAHKLNTLPLDLQHRVKTHLTKEQVLDLEDSSPDNTPHETKMIRVPMPTFPPTAMVYSVNKQSNNSDSNQNNDSRVDRLDAVPTDVITSVLTQPSPQRKPRRIYICYRCRTDKMFFDVGTQAPLSHPDAPNHFTHSHSFRSHPSAFLSSHPAVHVHRPRLNSTETEI